MKLLRIDASAKKQSVSRKLTARFAETWKRQNPEGTVIERDLTTTAIPALTDEWVQAVYTDPTKLTEEQRKILSVSDELIAELKDADIIVIGAPMYNFGIPATLKSWIDQVVRNGVTWLYTPNGPKGLLEGKKVFVLTSRGGAYQPGTPTEKFDFQAPYLKHIFGFIGITDVTFIHAENQSKETASAAFAHATQQIQQVAVAAH